jgi:hypothetical protein
LALADLCRTAAACRTLRRVATDDRLLWRARCLDRFGPEALETRAEGSSWEQHWATLLDHHRCGCELFNQNLVNVHSSIDISIFNDFFSADPLALVGALQGIDYLVEHRVLRAEPQAVADFLNKTPGLYKKSIGTYDRAAWLHMWMQESHSPHDAGWTLGRRAKDCSKEEETILDDVDAPELVRSFEGSSIQTAHAHAHTS